MSDASPIRAMVAPVTPLQQNCTIVWCVKTKKAAVIDPGGEVPRLLKGIADQGLTVEKIWITHGHMDHAAANRGAEGGHRRASSKARTPDDQFWIDGIEEAGAQYGVPGAKMLSPRTAGSTTAMW